MLERKACFGRSGHQGFLDWSRPCTLTGIGFSVNRGWADRLQADEACDLTVGKLFFSGAGRAQSSSRYLSAVGSLRT